MARLIGFLLGLLLVLALAIAIVRYSVLEIFSVEQTASADQPTQGDDVSAGVTSEPPIARAPPPESSPVGPAERPIDREDRLPPDATELAEQRPESPAPVSRPADGAPAAEDAAGGRPTSPPMREWYVFWQPFSSQIAAEGFRARLEHLTGLDYRVVSPSPGEYQVAFAYADESERQAALAAIEAATGLSVRTTSL